MTNVSNNVDLQALNAYRKMKSLATGLFILMVFVFLIAKTFETKFLWVSYIRAFGEAAMVGALADWFAVTALFRHPLGLPIPHTAIIPNSKDRIGSGLGNFISRNFLQPDQVKRRLENIDLGKGISDFLVDDEKRIKFSEAFAKALPRIFSLLKDGPIMDWLQSSIKSRLQVSDFATFFADWLKLLTEQKRHVKIIDLIIFHADLALTNYEPKFREKVSENTNWLPKLFSVDDTASNALISALKNSLHEASNDPNHELRNSINDAISHLEQNLRNDDELRSQIKAWQDEIINHPQINEYINGLWQSIKSNLSNMGNERQENLIKAIDNTLKNIANSLANNDELRSAIDERLKIWAVELAAAQGNEVGRMVADTIKSWDATTVVTQIETAVGRDLQYIRINGTVIGGLVGLIIHIISNLVFK